MKQTTIFVILIYLIICSCSRPLTQVYENYEINSPTLDSLSSYFYSIKPDSIDIWIRFNNENTFDIKLWDKKRIKTENSIFDKYGSFDKYENKINDSAIINVLDYISIDTSQLKYLETRLIQVNCNSIGYKCDFWDIRNGGGFIEIGYPTNGFYGLTYIIMDSTKDSVFLEKVNQMCNYKVINNKTLLQYGGPAWGSDCFPDKK